MTLTWLIVYIVGMFIVTLVFSRRRQTFEEFVLARRSVNFLPLLFSTWAANFGGGALIGWTGGFYQHGLDWWWLPVGFLLALVVANRFLVAKVRDLEQFTLPDLIGVRYGDRPRHLSAVVVIIVGVLAMSFQILALAGIVSTVAGISLSSAMVVSAVVFVLATVIGGLSSVVLTDLLQSAIMLLGLLLAVMFVIWQTGGLYELWTKLPETHRQFGALTRSGQGLGDGFAVFGAIATSQVLFQKVLAASSIAVAKRMVHWLIPSFLLTYLALWVFGSSALLLLGRNIGAETVLPQLIKVQFPPVLGGILMAAMLGVIITTANAILLGVASNITRDVYQPFLRRWGGQDRSVGVVRVAIVCVALLALGGAFWVGHIINMMLLCFWVAGVAVLVPLYGGYLWRRATPAAAEASIIAAMLGVVISYLIVSPVRIHPTVVGFLLSLGAFIAVTLLTSQPKDANLPPSVAAADLSFGDTQGDRHTEKSSDS